MNIKSLLLGSAAALVAVSGARAADAVVIAEPEPMEYVRICDVYGAGFFYIPGTETCLKFDGYFRYDLGFGENTGVDTNGGGIGLGDTYYSRMRAALRWDARSETELGTLRGYAHVNFDYDRNTANVGNNFSLNHAYIELAGFRIGKTDSLFSIITGYTSGVSNDGFAVPYGPFDTHVISYTFTGTNGFSATIGVEDLSGSGQPLNDYVPHVVGGFSWTQGWGGISAVAAYDSVAEEGAFKARLDVNATEALSLFIMGGYSTNDPAGNQQYGGDGPSDNGYATWRGDWAVWAGGAYKINEKAKINAEIEYDEDENFGITANVDYQIVPNMHIIPEIVYSDNFSSKNFTGARAGVKNNQIGGFIRFQRDF